ncbi:MAG: protein-export chaperone SecB, partial [Parasphingopyxis sp.]
VKDLSFENPGAPEVYQHQQTPQIDVQFNIGREKLGDDLWESILKLDVTAQAEDGKTAFKVELVYAALFRLIDVPEEQVQPFLLVDGPAMIFPYARRILADAVRDGNFPALMLEPIDFASLYVQQQQQMAQGGSDNVDMPTGNA